MNILSLIGTPFGWIMYYCYQFTQNYGLALILFTLLTKLVLLPFAIKQQKGMVKMAMFRPKMEEIQKKYAKNPQKLNEEMSALYAQENYNPLSGCLPTLVQMPVLIGLMGVIYYPLKHILRIPQPTVDAAIAIAKTVLGEGGMNRYSAEISVITAVGQDPSAFSLLGDSFLTTVQGFNFTFLGIDMGAMPTMAFNALLLIPILSGLSSFLMSRISVGQNTSVQGDGTAAQSNKMMMYTMPLMSVWIAFKVPAGVGIYWLFSNLFSIVQQSILTRIYNPTEIVEKVKAEMEQKKATERQERIEAKKNAKANSGVAKEKLLSQKEANRQKLAAARKRDAEKYGEEYVEVTDKDLE